jgi:hypothetical protein
MELFAIIVEIEMDEWGILELGRSERDAQPLIARNLAHLERFEHVAVEICEARGWSWKYQRFVPAVHAPEPPAPTPDTPMDFTAGRKRTMLRRGGPAPLFITALTGVDYE